MNTVFSGSARPRQTFFVTDVAVSVCSYSGMVRSVQVIFAASVTMTTEASMQAFVVAMSMTSLSH
jgi:hypothetical protein